MQSPPLDNKEEYLAWVSSLSIPRGMIPIEEPEHFPCIIVLDRAQNWIDTVYQTSFNEPE